MRSRTPDDFCGMCSRCYLKTEYCICEFLPKIQARTQIVILRHVTECRVMSNTGRLAALVLSNCHLLDFDPCQPFATSLLDPSDSWLLYPGPNPAPRGEPPKRLVLIDASFRRAKRMYKRMAALHQLPQLALPAPATAPARLRQPTRDDGMSTIEAIAAGLSLVEDPAIGSALLDVYAEFVRRADAAHGRVRAP